MPMSDTGHMKKSIQFSVTKNEDGSFCIIAQNDKEIIRSYEAKAYDIVRTLLAETELLRPLK